MFSSAMMIPVGLVNGISVRPFNGLPGAVASQNWNLNA